MLKMAPPSPLRRMAGRLAIGSITLAASAAIYAAQPSPSTYGASRGAVNEALALFDGAKTAVAAYWLAHQHQMPPDNAAAHLPDDLDPMTWKSVRRITVHDGVIIATLRDHHDSSATAGTMRLVPRPYPGKDALAWSCQSTDIPTIASLAPGCTYQPASGRSSVSHTLKLELGVEGQPARLHVKTCLGPGQHYQTIQGGIDPLPPWDARFTVVPAANGMLEIQAQVSGGTLDHVIYPKLITRPGQQAVIEIGRRSEKTAGHDAANHTLRAELIPTVGC